MLRLTAKLLGLFAFQSKRSLYIAVGVFLIAISIVPAVLDSAGRFLFIGPRLDQLIKLNSLDRAKIKEPAVRGGYDRLLKDMANDSPIVAAMTAKPPATICDYFKRANIAPFLTASILWILLGLVGLFDQGEGGAIRALTLLLFIALGGLSGVAAENLPMLRPIGMYIFVVVTIELLFMSVCGTLIGDIASKRA